MSTEFINDQWRLPNEENKSKVSNYSMDFDGSSQYVNLGDDDIFSFGDGSSDSPFSISAWIYMDSTTNFRIVSKYDAPNYEYQFDVGGSSNLRFYIFDGSSYRARTGSTLSINQWYHVVATYNGVGGANAENGIKIYVDGVEITGTTSSSGSYTAMHNTSAPVYIGRIASSYANGKIDGVSIFNYALSSSQVTTLYGSSSTGIGNPMTLNPVAYYPLGDQDAFNGAEYLTPNASLKDFVFNFNSSNQTAITVSNISYTIYTASVWFKPNTNISTSTTQQFLLYFNTAYSPVKSIRLGGGSDIISTTMGSGLTRYYSGSDIPANQWANVTISFNNGNQYSIFLNGVDVSDTRAAALGSSSGLIIGERAILPAGFNGEISNVLIWDTQALSATEVETLYNNGSPIENLSDIPQNSNLQGWWKLDASATYDSSTQTWTIPDDSTNSNDGTSSGMTQANLVQSDLSFTSGYSPYALDFDGTNDYIQIPNISTINTSGNVSISFWMKTSNTTTTQSPVRLQGDTIGFYMYSDGLVRMYGSSTGRLDSSIASNDGEWHLVVGVYGTSAQKLYIDNVVTASDVGFQGTIGTTGGAIGSRYFSSANTLFEGQISNCSVWNTALTSAQVSEIYNEGVPSNLNNHSAYSNLISWWQLGSNSSFNTNWTVLNEISTGPNGTSVNMTEADIVDGVGSSANGLSSGMGGDEVIGDAPYSSSNALSVNMDVEDRVTDTPS